MIRFEYANVTEVEMEAERARWERNAPERERAIPPIRWEDEESEWDLASALGLGAPTE